jgi:hypothetical protein
MTIYLAIFVFTDGEDLAVIGRLTSTGIEFCTLLGERIKGLSDAKHFQNFERTFSIRPTRHTNQPNKISSSTTQHTCLKKPPE